MISKQNLRKILQEYKKQGLSNEMLAEEIIKKFPSDDIFTDEKVFSGSDILLAEHRFSDKPVLMGVTHISLVLEKLKEKILAGKTIQLQKVLFLQALILEPTAKARLKLQLEFENSDKGYFHNSYQLDSEAKYTPSAEGQILLSDEIAAPDIKFFESIKNYMQENAANFQLGDTFYQNPAQRIYGPNLFTVKKVYFRDEKEAIGEIELSQILQPDTKTQILHPAIFDGLHVLASFAAAQQIPLETHWPPLLVKKLTVFPAVIQSPVIQAIVWAKITQKTSELIESNIKLFTPTGELILNIEGFCTKRISALSKDSQIVIEKQPESKATVVAETKPTDLKAAVSHYILAKFKERLGIKELDMQKNFMMLGLDSTTMIGLAREIEQELSIELYPTLFFERENLEQLINYFVEDHPAAFKQFVQKSGSITATIDIPAATLPLPQENKLSEKNTLNKIQSKITIHDDNSIAIIGMAGRFAGADNLEQFWENIIKSQDMISEIPLDHWDYRPWFSHDPEIPNKTYSKWGSFLNDVDKFDPLFFEMSAREATWVDPQVRLLLQIFQQAADDAALGNKVYGSNTGVYVGSCFHEYWDEIVRAQIPMVDYQHMSSAMSSLSARLSYTYDLRGASIPLDNACASSLTATHLACQALRANEIDMAFVAGINLLLSPLHYVYFSRMKALSPTGHCYSFDERADGYVPGEGAVGVLLKRLDRALADGDVIHAVIKGSAINHVGRSNNPAAPRPEQQIALLKDAWHNAGINPETLSYLEAHGTGTKLGDPIEVNSLLQAFKEYTTEKSFCALGSAKSHIGHLEAAAGLAGVVKVVLSMRHGQIPKMPMYQKQNAYFRIDNTPLYINNEVIPWPNKAKLPKRAGVSSFGMTGNNAHIVLEEAPVYTLSTQQTKPAYLITLSAKHIESLDQMLEDLHNYLDKNANVTLEAISYTLNIGRNHFNHRLALIAHSLADLKNKLQQLRKNSEVPGCFKGNNKQQLDDHELNKKTLETTQKTLSEEPSSDLTTYQQCLETLAQLYVKGFDLDWMVLHTGESQQKVHLPGYAFLKQRYWIPTEHLQTKTEHKISSSIATVNLLHPLVHQNASELEKIVFKSYFDGHEFYFNDHRVQQQAILPGVAYIEMARAAVALAAPHYRISEIRNINWLSPMNVQGETKEIIIELSPKEAIVEYKIYTKQSDQTQMYSQGSVCFDTQTAKPAAWVSPSSSISTSDQALLKVDLYKQFDQLGLYYGPAFQSIEWAKTNGEIGLAYYQLPKEILTDVKDYVLHPSILDGALQSIAVLSINEQPKLELPFALEKLCIYQEIASIGYVLSRKQLSQNQKVKKYDLQILNEQGNVCVEIYGFSTRPLAVESPIHYLLPQWKAADLIHKDSNVMPTGIAVLSADDSLLNLKSAWPATPFVQLSYDQCNDETQAQEWWKKLQQQEITVSHLIIDGTELSPEQFIDRILKSQMILIKARMQLKTPGKFSWYTLYSHDENSIGFGKALHGLAKTIYQEHAKYIGHAIGFSPDVAKEQQILLLQAELVAPVDQPLHIRYVKQQRFIEIVEDTKQIELLTNELTFKQNGNYLITGGLGGLGRIVANYLIKEYNANLILTGRAELGEIQHEQLTELRKCKTKIDYYQGDVADQSTVENWISKLKNDFGKLDGIIHSAGILKDGLLLNKAWPDFEAVMATKVKGTLNLDRATIKEELDCFILFSSISSLMGNNGQSDYALANGFMDDFANWRDYQRKCGNRYGKTRAINWPLWKSGGMRIAAEIEKYLNSQGIGTLSNNQGLLILEQSLRYAQPQLGVYIKTALSPQTENNLIVNQQHEHKEPVMPESIIDDTIVRQKIMDELQKNVSDVLQIPVSALDPNEDLSSYGFDSFTFTEFANRLKQQYPITIAPTVFFEYPTLTEFTDYLMLEHYDLLQELYQPKSTSNKSPTDNRSAQKEATQTSAPVVTKMPEKQSDQFQTLQQSGRLMQKTHPQVEDIAIIGMAGVFPEAPNLEVFWKNLIEGKDCISEIPNDRWRWQDYDNEEFKLPKWGGFISDVDKFDAAFFGISPREAELMDPQHRLFLQCVWKSLEDAGYVKSQLRETVAGLFVGVANQDYAEFTQQHSNVEAYTSTGLAHSILANRISYLLNLTGPSEPIDTACSSSLVALHRAVQAIQTQDCDIAIAGGVNVLLTPTLYISFNKAGMLSPEGRCKTFDKNANGYVRGEGVGAIVLKSLSKALEDGNPIYAVVKGSAINHGGHVNTLTAPNPNAQAELIKTACRRAAIPVNTISYIEAHGTGTSLGDPIEINALKKAFKALQKEQQNNADTDLQCYLGAVKTNIGHLETAAGIAGVIKVLLSMRYQMLPPSIHFQALNPYIDLQDSNFRILDKPQSWQTTTKNGYVIPRRAGISSFGFGGVNAHVILEEPPVRVIQKQIIEKPYYLLTFSAKTADTLLQKLVEFKGWLSYTKDTQLSAISYTLNAGRNHFNHRCAFVVAATDFDQLSDLLEQIIHNQTAVNFFKGTLTDVLPDDAVIYEEVLERTAQQLAAGIDDIKRYEKQLKIIANLYVKGYEVDWNLLHQNEPKQIISLPTYPFLKTRYWITEEKNTIKSVPIIPQQINSFDEILQLIKTKLAELTKIAPENLDIYTDITSYGFDSIVVAGLAKEFEKIFGKKDVSVIFAAKNIHDLALRIHQQCGHHDIYSESTDIYPALDTDDVAIIGISGRYPEADNLYELFENLKQGKHIMEEIPKERWDYKKYYAENTMEQGKTYAKWGSFIKDADCFDYEHFKMSFNEALMVHPEERLLLEEAWHCFESAGYNPLQWTTQLSNKIGVYIGASFHDYQQIIAEANQHKDTYLPFTSQIYSYANRLSYFFNLKGPSVAIDTACSSSLFAVAEAYYAVRAGRCTMALAGGVNLNLHPSKYILLSQFNFMAKDGKCHAFTEGGTGYVPGEGIGLVLLKRLTDAIHDQDNILAVIKGAASGNDGKTNGFTVPNPDAQSQVILSAMEEANIRPSQVSFIECHGTGTQLGDPIEISALTEVFAKDTQKKQFCAISSIKSNIGHLEAAAGIAQVSKVILQMQSQKLFPNVMHGRKLNHYIQFAETPFYVQDRFAEWPAKHSPRIAGISSFGAGGTNVHLILAEPQLQVMAQPIESAKEICYTFSADSEIQLFEYIEKIYKFLSQDCYHIFNNQYTPKNIAYTLQQGRAERCYRLALVCAGTMDVLISELQNIIKYYQLNKTFDGKPQVYFNAVNYSSKNNSTHETFESEYCHDLAAAWVKGKQINWKKINGNYQKLMLPGYSFRRHSVTLQNKTDIQTTPVTSLIQQEDTIKANIYKIIRECFIKILGKLPDEFASIESFQYLGIDSITGSRIHLELAKQYAGLDDFVLIENDNAKKLVDYLYEHYHQPMIIASPVARIEQPAESEQIGDIANLLSQQQLQSAASEKILIAMNQYIRAYEMYGGKLKMILQKLTLANKKNIEILVCGEGEPLIFLPPFNTTAIVWINQITYLSKYFKVIVIHYPGIGSSDWVEKLTTFSDLAKIIIEVIDLMRAKHIINAHPIRLIGWSFGGFLAQAIASEYLEYVHSLVLVSTTTISWSSKEYRISGEEFSRRSAEQFKKNYKKLPAFIKKMPEVKKLYEQDKIAGFVLGTLDNAVISAYFLMIAKFRHINVAEQIKVKTHLISGEEDDLMPAKFARELQQKIPNSDYYEVQGGEHFMSLFNKNVVNNKLYEWLMI